jgi:putative membrane protein
MTTTILRRTTFLFTLAAVAAFGGGRCLADGDAGIKGRGDLAENEVLGVIRAINQGEVDHANAVQGRLVDPEVRAFAEMMIHDHREAVNTIDDLARNIAITPADSDKTRDLQKDVQDRIQGLVDERGRDVDEKFLDDQEELHENALKMIDDTLLKATKRPDIARMLGEMRASVAAHLERVRQLKDRKH